MAPVPSGDFFPQALSVREATTVRAKERIILIGILRGPAAAGQAREVDEESLKELRDLAAAAGGVPVGSCLQRASAPHPQTYLGTGKVKDLADMARRLSADLILADDDLTPAQVRQIEAATNTRTIDRSELILAIFAQRARTREAHDQVELAQLEYLLPRLKGMWTHLEKIKGGIGMRGPGEKQIEIDRRLIDRKIQALRKRTGAIVARRDREVASRAREFSTALVGYTNAGKSTLMNRLTGAGVVANDRLFETLATRTCRLALPHGGTVLVSDTIGFIRKLPHHLISSFRATLSEAQSADLLLHVIDASALSPQPAEQLAASEEVLQSLGRAPSHTIIVANKMDKGIADGSLAWLERRARAVVPVSALTGDGVPELFAEIEKAVEERRRTLHLTCWAGDGALLSALRQRGRILSQHLRGGTRYHIKARLAPDDWFCIRPLGRDTIRARWKETP